MRRREEGPEGQVQSPQTYQQCWGPSSQSFLLSGSSIVAPKKGGTSELALQVCSQRSRHRCPRM